ncbi:hypothetical protein [Acidithiobacillus sp.]|uniref:hypothetical protein n=1 Tax=Acidithiobacillus sp. TaxID=1872118 RepID=UPI002582B169|nr:hypothetical protein [Acidithiobacillus sp.]MDD5375278.1 hypothetical protein [Acidithiobacillus sp.]
MTDPITSFKGLNNVTDPLRLDMRSLTQADNINITDTGAIAKRDGYTLSQAGNYSSIYSTRDFQRAYSVQGSDLNAFDGATLATLTSTEPMFWCQVNNDVLFSNGIDAGIIQPDNTVIPWRWNMFQSPTLAAVTGDLPAGLYRVLCSYSLDDGRETGGSDPVEIELTDGQALQITDIPQQAGCATNVYVCPANSSVFSLYRTTIQTALTWNFSPDNLGRDFRNDQCDPLPLGIECIQAWRGRVYASQYMASDDQTVIWASEPLAPHLFKLASGFFMVPGHVHMLAETDTGLVIGTDQAIHAYDGQSLAQLADYGVVPGKPWDTDDSRVLIWTVRGLCSALPFENLTEHQVSVAPGVRAAGCVIRAGGQKRFVAVLQTGGEAFNAYA